MRKTGYIGYPVFVIKMVKNLVIRSVGSFQDLSFSTTAHQILIGFVREVAITLDVNELLLLTRQLARFHFQ